MKEVKQTEPVIDVNAWYFSQQNGWQHGSEIIAGKIWDRKLNAALYNITDVEFEETKSGKDGTQTV